MAAIDAPAGKLDIGDVIGQTFRVIGRNFVPFSIMSLLVSGVPSGAVNAFQLRYMASGAAMFGPDRWAWGLTGFLIMLVTGIVVQATMIQGAVASLNGQKTRLTEGLANGLRLFLPLLGLGILMALALALGFVLLIVPGIMMALAWCVASPTLVIERTGVFAAFSRSAFLTRGNRWRIFGLFIVYVVISIMISILVGVVVMALAAAASGLDGAKAMMPFTVVSNVITNTLSTMITATAVAVLYVDLRRLREGVGSESLASVFD